MPSLLDDPEAYAFAAQVAEDSRRKLTNQQALNAILQGVGDLPYSLLGAPVDISTGLLRAAGYAQGEQIGGGDWVKRQATELGIRPPESTDPTMRDMRMGAEIVSGAIDPTRVARAGGAVAGAVAREAKPVIGNAIESYMVKSGLAPRVVPEGGAQGGLLGQTSKSLSDIENKFKDVSLDLYEKNNTINLSRIVVPKDIRNSGVGTDVMQDLVSYADQTGQKVALTPSSDFGGNVKKLKEFYKRFGFVENKGKNKDFTTRESMIRPAKEQEISGAQGGLLSAVPTNDVADTLIYHGTTPSAAKAIEKSGFDVSKSADGTIWFTSNPNIGEVAASGKGAVVNRKLNESNLKLAGWDEIDKYSVDELVNMGYDGVKMPDGNQTTYQIFNPEKLKK
jgi:predicted GNAT family acetyltransferase